MLSFTEFLDEEKKFDEKKHRWITIKDKNMQNQHIMLNKKDGTIAAGMGGKHNGESLDDIYDGAKKKKETLSSKIETPKKAEKSSATDDTSSKSKKKPTKKEIRDSITDESLKKLSNISAVIGNLTLQSKRQSIITNVKNKCINAFQDLPSSLKKANKEEYQELLDKEKRLWSIAGNIKMASSLAKKLKNNEPLNKADKELLNKALEMGGVDKLIDKHIKQYDDTMSSMKQFVTKCKTLKSDYNTTPEGKNAKKSEEYQEEFNWAGKWKPSAPYGSKQYDWEYDETERKKKLNVALSYLEDDIRKSKGSAEISLNDKKLILNKDGSYTYDGKAVDREKALNLVQDNKEVSVKIK